MHILTSPTSHTDSATLAGNTDYLVVFKATGNSAADCQLGGTTSDAEDASGATGWSIEDTRRFNGTVTLFGVDFLISLSGTVDTTPPTPSSGHNVNTNGGYVDLSFDEDLDENFPPASVWTVNVGDVSFDVTGRAFRWAATRRESGSSSTARSRWDRWSQ